MSTTSLLLKSFKIQPNSLEVVVDVLALIGRVLFALLFLGSAYGHLANSAAMAGYAKAKKLPAARFFVIASGIWIALGALAVLFGVWADLGALMLAAFLFATAFVFQGFWSETDPQARQATMIQFQKDIALAGASLLLFVLFTSGEVGLTLTGPLF